jgi:predicted TPR repeat methyltransferase
VDNRGHVIVLGAAGAGYPDARRSLLIRSGIQVRPSLLAMTDGGNEELAERYDAWAEEYDADLQSYGFRSPAIAAGIMGRYVPRDSSPILDAGAGTGFMGEVLNTLGYKVITALDLSEGVLEVADRKGVYADLRQMALGNDLDFPSD